MADSGSQAPEPYLKPKIPTQRLRIDIESDGVNGNGNGRVYSELDREITRNGAKPAKTKLRSELGTEVDTSVASWAWPGRIPLGAVTILEGDPDCGKSAIACWLAAQFTRGLRMPDWQEDAKWGLDGPVHVGYISGEDSTGITLLPRFLVAGGDPNLIHYSLDVWTPKGEEPFMLPSHFDALKGFIEEHSLRVVIIDVLSAFTDGSVDTYSDASVRRMLSPMKKLAEETGSVILILRHLVKGHGPKAIYAGQGSIAYGGMARSVLLASEHPDEDEEGSFIFAVTKCNMAPRSWRQTLTYELHSVPFTASTGEIATQVDVAFGGTVDLTANQITGGHKESPRQVAKEFIIRMLESGPCKATEMIAEASTEGIAKRTLMRAKETLGIESVQVMKDGTLDYWLWQYPESAT